MYISISLPISLSLFGALVIANPINVNPYRGGEIAHGHPRLIRPSKTSNSTIIASSTASATAEFNPFLPGNGPKNWTVPSPAPKIYKPYCLGRIGLNLDADKLCRTGKHVFDGIVLGVHCVGNKIEVEGIDPYQVCKKTPTQDVNLEGGWTPGCKCVEEVLWREILTLDENRNGVPDVEEQ